MIIGSKISSYLKLNEKNSRIISGNVLTGTKISHDGNLRFYSNEITAIPEGNDYDLFGWAKPMFNKFSLSRALTFSWLFPNKKYNLNTNTNGEHRAFVVSGSFEEVFPLNIYPLQILKACMYKDLDEMEALGMYEVAPEDFALTEFICVSKQPHQNIIREGLDLMKKNWLDMFIKSKLHEIKRVLKGKMAPAFNAFHTFLFTPNDVTSNGTHESCRRP